MIQWNPHSGMMHSDRLNTTQKVICVLDRFNCIKIYTLGGLKSVGWIYSVDCSVKMCTTKIQVGLH